MQHHPVNLLLRDGVYERRETSVGSTGTARNGTRRSEGGGVQKASESYSRKLGFNAVHPTDGEAYLFRRDGSVRESDSRGDHLREPPSVKLLQSQRLERHLAVEAEDSLAYIWPTQRRICRIPRIYSHLNL